MVIVGDTKIKVGKWHEMPRKKASFFLNVSREWSYFERRHSKYSGRSRVIRGRVGRREGRMGGRGGEGGSRAKPGNQLVSYIILLTELSSLHIQLPTNFLITDWQY